MKSKVGVMGRVRRWMVAFTVLCTIAAGCSHSKDYRELVHDEVGQDPPASLVNVDPSSLEDGGRLNIAISEYPATLNPLRADAPSLALRMASATYPRVFRVQPDGSPTLDEDYFTAAEVVQENPQIVSLTINPKAVWSDGTPITWQDLRCQAKLLSGDDPAFSASSAPGFDRIKDVTQGATERVALVTFKEGQRFSEWKGMFALPYALLPCSVIANPVAFNSGIESGSPSAGPFVVTTADEESGVIVFTRNPKWWGTAPRLESIVLGVVAPGTEIDRVEAEDDAYDFAQIASDDDLVKLEGWEDVIDVVSSSQRGWSSLVFNTTAPRPTEDEDFRRAIAMAIDRKTLASIVYRGLTSVPITQDSNMVVGEPPASNPSWRIPYNPGEAGRKLDQLGWKLSGDVRTNGSRELELRMVSSYSDDGIVEVLRQQLGEIGVELDVVNVEGLEQVDLGDFDMALTSWSPDAFPLRGAYQFRVGKLFQTFGCCGPVADAAIDAAATAETDDEMSDALSEVDSALWREARVLPLAQTPEVVAVWHTVANLGTSGIADIDYAAIGFEE